MMTLVQIVMTLVASDRPHSSQSRQSQSNHSTNALITYSWQAARGQYMNQGNSEDSEL